MNVSTYTVARDSLSELVQRAFDGEEIIIAKTLRLRRCREGEGGIVIAIDRVRGRWSDIMAAVTYFDRTIICTVRGRIDGVALERVGDNPIQDLLDADTSKKHVGLEQRVERLEAAVAKLGGTT